MRFLAKNPADLTGHLNLEYAKAADRKEACDLLCRLQFGFCAYSERYLKPLDSVEVEHFDPRIKGTSSDNILNWHAVIRWMNAHKPRKIEAYLPLPDLASWDSSRVWYKRGEFRCAESDKEAENLIKFLGVNRKEVFDERQKHVARIQRMQKRCGDELLAEVLKEESEELAFPSALEAELGIPAFELIEGVMGTQN